MSEKKLATNIVIYGLSNGLKSLVPFIMVPILTTYISADGVGVLSLIETSILFLTPFILLNLESGISVEYYKTDKQNLAQYLTNGIYLALLSFVMVSAILWLGSGVIQTYLDIPKEILLLLPIFVLLRLIPTVVLVLFQAQQKAGLYLGYSLFQTIVDFALSALFIMVWSHGYFGRLEGTYLAFFAATIIGIFLLFRMGYIDFTYSIDKMKQVLKFGGPLIPHVIGGTIIALSDRYFVSIFEGNEQVGFYTVAYQIGALLLLFSRSVNQAWSPMLYQYLNEKKFSQIEKITGVLFVLFILVGAAVYFLEDFIFDLLVNESFFAAKDYVGLLLLGFLFQSIYFLFTNFIFYKKRTDILAVITFSGAILNLILNYFLIQKMGVIGVAYATAITWFIFMAATFMVATFKIYRIEKYS